MVLISRTCTANKRAMTLNLKDQKGLEVFRRLVEKADVVVENFRPDVKAGLGINYDSLRRINPRIVYGSISGFGQDGPYRVRASIRSAGHGLVYVKYVATGGDAHPTDHSHTTRGCSACERRRAKPTEATGRS
jgi:crotonobetainyl-CoA:carnitine CoA-transferase CaiB-like acyl-CoA transferase